MNTVSLLALALAMSAPASEPVGNLGRVFTKGEKLTYQVRSTLNAEASFGELRTRIPEDLDINYDFTLEVKALKTDGIAVMRYVRPTMTIIEGETFDAPPKTKVEKVDFDLDLTVSPINEIIDQKENPKKAAAKPAPKKKGVYGPPGPGQQHPMQSVIDQFVGEMYRLSLFAGSFDSALDFSPKLRSVDVAVGDTWHKTVGYQPRKLKGKDGKSVVHRLDYEYTYKGPVTVNGKKFLRVEAALDFTTDLAEFINDTWDLKSSDTGIRKLPLQMASKVIFNLDPTTRHCVFAEANTNGSFAMFLEGGADTPYYDSRMKGRTTLRLANRVVPKAKR